MAFGTLAAVIAIGGFVSSIVLGLLWSRFSPAVAFGTTAILFWSGAWLVFRLR
ncbi:MAG TPA: hypothetical protein VNN17_10845 [Terriglobia bacterium]|nr:hypothetical protein [Terriglobia bacterium]